MPYDIESQSRNADFILIALRAIPQPSGQRPVKLKNPPAHKAGQSKEPIPAQPFYTTRRRQAATTLGPKGRQPSPLNLLNPHIICLEGGRLEDLSLLDLSPLQHEHAFGIMVIGAIEDIPLNHV